MAYPYDTVRARTEVRLIGREQWSLITLHSYAPDSVEFKIVGHVDRSAVEVIETLERDGYHDTGVVEGRVYIIVYELSDEQYDLRTAHDIAVDVLGIEPYVAP